MSDWAPNQEAESLGCMALVFCSLITLLGGIAIGFWVLK